MNIDNAGQDIKSARVESAAIAAVGTSTVSPLSRANPSKNTTRNKARPKTAEGSPTPNCKVARMSSPKGNTAEIIGSIAAKATLGILRDKNALAPPNTTANPPTTHIN